MRRVKVTESELREKGVIKNDFGEELSWEYLCYIRNNPILWNVPTDILYGSEDVMTSIDIVTTFAEKHNGRLTVMDGGGHGFIQRRRCGFWTPGSEKQLDVARITAKLSEIRRPCVKSP